MNDISPEAYCDALFILNDAPRSSVPMSVIESHLFSYLGCVLALYKGTPIGDWGYGYAVTKDGFPFSPQFEDARRSLVDRGLIDIAENGYMTPRYVEIESEIEMMKSIGNWDIRQSLLKTSTSCSLIVPMGSIRHAVSQSPGMPKSYSLRQNKALLDDDAIEILYDEYSVIRQALGETDGDLLSPAVIWLSARIMRSEDTELGL